MTNEVEGELISTKATPWRPVSLSTVRSVRREMTRIYNAARAGEIEVQAATRLTYILGEIRRTLEIVELERRLAALELTVEKKADA